MTEKEIATDKWNEYLEGLYQWITDKYELLSDDSIEYSDSNYQTDLEYYEKEKERIQNLVESGDKPVEDKTDFQLNQKTFESFFGVSVTEDTSASNSSTLTPLPSDASMPNSKLEIKLDNMNRIVEVGEEREKIVDFSVFEELDQEPQTTAQNILLIGDSSTGRTSIRRSWFGKHHIDYHLTTIGASMDTKSVNVDERPIDVTLIDLGGQDFYKAVRGNFYRKVDGAVIVFDLTSRESFMRLDYWVKEFYRSIKTLVPFVIVGNKADLKGRQIKEKEGILVAANYSRHTLPKFKVRYVETSAKDAKGINELFNMIIREIKAFQVAQVR